jgi:AcrR family transcriptional regulator
VFGTKGLAAATVQDLVREAGVSRETFYRYFTDKEDCLRLLHDELLAWLEEEAAAAAEGRTWASGVIAVCRHLALLFAEDRRVARVCAVEFLLGGPEIVARHVAAAGRAAEALRRGRADAGDRMPDALESILIAGAVSLLGGRITSARERSPDILAAEVAELILIFYVDREEAARLVRGTA